MRLKDIQGVKNVPVSQSLSANGLSRFKSFQINFRNEISFESESSSCYETLFVILRRKLFIVAMEMELKKIYQSVVKFKCLGKPWYDTKIPLENWNLSTIC